MLTQVPSSEVTVVQYMASLSRWSWEACVYLLLPVCGLQVYLWMLDLKRES